jgi:hypothetical protein
MIRRAGPAPGDGRTDRQLAGLDVTALLREGLAAAGAAGAGTGRAELNGSGRIAAAIAADRLGVQPRSLTFLAEVVRRGGIGYAAGLPEPLPGAERAELARDWLSAAVGAGPGADKEFARWLDAVAVILGLRRRAARPPGH